MQLHPMPEFGSFTLLLALALSVYTLVVGGVALWRTRELARHRSGGAARLGETARRAGIASFVALCCAAFALVWASFTNDYSVSYILHHTNRALNPAYKFSALWSGQEGSLLLWAWLLSAYGFVLRLRHRVDVRLTAFASTILAGIQVFFLLLLNFAAPPFAIQPGPLAADGIGLNPLLQYPEMVIHPPMLYLGYVGIFGAVCVCAGRADDAVSGREVDPHYAALDDGDVAVSDRAGSFWARTGLIACWAGAATGAGTRWRMRA